MVATKKILAPAVERIGFLYWDTFRSWEDEVAEKATSFSLFIGGHQNRSPVVTNFTGNGCFLGNASVKLNAVGLFIRVSNPRLKDEAVGSLSGTLWITDKPYVSMHAGLFPALDPDFEPKDPPLGMQCVEPQIVIPPRQYFHVDLNFSPEFAEKMRHMRTRVGPGAGWVEAVVFIAGERTRELQ